MKKPVLGAFALLCAATAFAHDYRIGDLAIGHPYARPTAPSQPAGGGYLTIANKGGDDRLVAASAPVAASVQLHSMKLDGDVMRMREIGTIDVPAGKTVELKPGGLHLMLMGLKAPLKAGDRFPLKLKFEKAGEVTVDVTVDAAPAAADASAHKTH